MRKNDEIIFQLQKRNDEVIFQLLKKNEEVEELRAQNQKILTQLVLVLNQSQQNQRTSKNHYYFYHPSNLFHITS